MHFLCHRAHKICSPELLLSEIKQIKLLLNKNVQTTSYTELTTRHLRKRIKGHVPKSVEIFCFADKKDVIAVKVLNASKRSSIAEHLVNNPTCANSDNIKRLKLVVMYSI